MSTEVAIFIYITMFCWQDSNISKKGKKEIVKIYVYSQFLSFTFYGIWATREQQEEEVETAEMKFLRNVADYKMKY